MNAVLIRINSYSQQARIFINDREPSSLSELANYNYAQYLANPGEILDAISRELNDDFSLSITGNAHEYELFAQAAGGNDYCVSCTKSAPAVAMSSKDRAKRLAQVLEIQTHIVQIVGAWTELPLANMEYGPIAVSFASAPTSDPALKITPGTKLTFDTASSTVTYPAQPSQEQLEAIIETHLINPIIGKTVTNHAGEDLNIQILARLTPVLRVSCPQMMEAGKEASVAIEPFPDFSAMPSVVIESQNSDVVAVEGTTLIARATGSTTIKAYRAGENKPFFSQQISCESKVMVSTLKIIGLDVVMNEGCNVPVSVQVFPADALDAQDITWESSDPSVAEIIGGQITLKSAGTCKITAKASQVSATCEVTVQPKLRRLQISESNVQLNVGKRQPISVTTTPSNAHNSSYKWSSTDESVAIVVEEDGHEVIKAVGIGKCTLTCASAGGEFSSSCEVSVQSIMYAEHYKKASRRKRWGIFCLLVFIVFLMVADGVSSIKSRRDDKEALADNPPAADQVETVEPNENNAQSDAQTDNTDVEPVAPDLVEIDVFDPESVSFEFSGISGEAAVAVNILSSDPVYSRFNYEFTPAADLSNGDEVVVNVSYYPKDIMDLGYIPPEITVKNLTVSGLTAYIDDPNVIPEDILNPLLQQSLDFSLAEEASEVEAGSSIVKGSEVAGVYFLSTENVSDSFVFKYDLMHNAVVVITSFEMRDAFWGRNSILRYAWIFPDYLIDPDGTVYSDSEDIYSNLVPAVYEDPIEWFKVESSSIIVTQIPV